MSCCGCASRVLKLQSEIRSWKKKLANEKREKKMILKWILTVFGYDVKVDIDKPSRGIRLEANENKEASSKALLKLVGISGNEGDFGVMVMEVKLEDHEFFEPYEEIHDVPEFPILEINSMQVGLTGNQTNSSAAPPILNTGLGQSLTPFGHLPSTLNPVPVPVPGLSITTPMEVIPPVSNNPIVGDPEVLYLTGEFESGATLEVPNGQSYIIVRTNENDDISSTIPMHMDYSTSIVGEDIITEDSSGNLVFSTGPTTATTFLPSVNPNHISISTPPAVQIPSPIVHISPPTVQIPSPMMQLPPAAVVPPGPVPVPLQFSFSNATPSAVLVDNVSDHHHQVQTQPAPPPLAPQTIPIIKSTSKKKKSLSLSSQASQALSIANSSSTSTNNSNSSKPSTKKKKQTPPIHSYSDSSTKVISSQLPFTSLTPSGNNSQQFSLQEHLVTGSNFYRTEGTDSSGQLYNHHPKSPYDSSQSRRGKTEMYALQKTKDAGDQNPFV